MLFDRSVDMFIFVLKFGETPELEIYIKFEKINLSYNVQELQDKII